MFNKHKDEIVSKIKPLFGLEYTKQKSLPVDAMLYDQFFDRQDTSDLSIIRREQPANLSSDIHKFKDQRLNQLIPLYKARNYPKYLNNEEILEYEKYRQTALFDGGVNSKFNKFISRLSELSTSKTITSSQSYIIEELKLYAESIYPSDLG